MGTHLYVNNSKGNSVSVIDTVTNTVTKTIPVEAGPVFSLRVGNKLYVHSADAGKISVIYQDAPLLNSLSSTTANGKYGIGAKIDISMIFDQPLLTGSTATVTLNNGVILTLSKVDGRSLFWEYVVATGQDKADLSVTSLKDVKIIGISGLQNTVYAIPTWKNLGDYKNIVIDSKITTTTPATPTPVELACRDTGMYRLCPLTKTPENTMEYRENMMCEWFINEDQSRSKRISRIEVLNIAVNMLHGPKTPATDYTNVYTDITGEGNSQETVSVVQTGLDNGLIFANNGAFEPTKKISRIEAYALLMRGVCMSPVEGEEDMARAIHQKAMQESITTKQWAKFRPYSVITRNEVFIVASALADWADKNGGCDKLECRK